MNSFPTSVAGLCGHVVGAAAPPRRRGSAARAAPPAAPSPFWALLGLLQRQPGMEWLELAGHAEDGGGGGAGALSWTAENHPLGPWPLKTLSLLEDSRDRHVWQAYHEGLKSFLAFREAMALPAVWPIPADQVREFLVAMNSQDLPSADITVYVEALSFISKLAGHFDPLQDPVTCHMIRRFKCGTGPSKDKYSPVTIEVLRSLLGALESVCSSPYECVLFHALFTVAFFGALRIEEMVVRHQSVAQPELLYLRDLQLSEGSALLCLHPARAGQERFLIRLGFSRETWVCPVEALWIYMAARPQGEGPLFVHSDHAPVSRREFLMVFRRALGLVGLPPEQYGVHSFWLGTVVTAITQGYSDEAVSQIARW